MRQQYSSGFNTSSGMDCSSSYNDNIRSALWVRTEICSARCKPWRMNMLNFGWKLKDWGRIWSRGAPRHEHWPCPIRSQSGFWLEPPWRTEALIIFPPPATLGRNLQSKYLVRLRVNWTTMLLKTCHSGMILIWASKVYLSVTFFFPLAMRGFWSQAVRDIWPKIFKQKLPVFFPSAEGSFFYFCMIFSYEALVVLFEYKIACWKPPVNSYWKVRLGWKKVSKRKPTRRTIFSLSLVNFDFSLLTILTLVSDLKDIYSWKSYIGLNYVFPSTEDRFDFAQ